MAALTAVVPTAPGVAYTPAAVSASDTINQSQLGNLGAYLLVINGGGSPDTVAISDSSPTQAGNSPAATSGGSVTNGTNKAFYINPRAVNPTTGNVTVTHSFTTSVTCILIPIG
jgi:hypothetical protein